MVKSLKASRDTVLEKTLHRDKLTPGRLEVGTQMLWDGRTEGLSPESAVLFVAHFSPLSFGVDPSYFS